MGICNAQDFTSVAIPIFGGGAAGFFFPKIADIIIIEVSNYLYNNRGNCSLKTVYIVERNFNKGEIIK
jgi:O-acetyl-ADP-ribose deacetylase (regulator of RNase III)